MASIPAYSQKLNNPGNKITASALEGYVSFLASPLLKGRMNGEEGLEIAGEYLASQAKLLGLRPANGNNFFQPYSVFKKTMNPEKTSIQVISGSKTEPVKFEEYWTFSKNPSQSQWKLSAIQQQ